ncbi:hypothetical protein OAQ84_00900 [Bdellovibrionales bacterium]|nr:hypothetical protein [Bdellovibrionales bacterium]
MADPTQRETLIKSLEEVRWLTFTIAGMAVVGRGDNTSHWIMTLAPILLAVFTAIFINKRIKTIQDTIRGRQEEV